MLLNARFDQYNAQKKLLLQDYVLGPEKLLREQEESNLGVVISNELT